MSIPVIITSTLIASAIYWVMVGAAEGAVSLVSGRNIKMPWFMTWIPFVSGLAVSLLILYYLTPGT